MPPLCSGEQGFTFPPPTLSVRTPDNSPSWAQTPGASRPTCAVQATQSFTASLDISLSLQRTLCNTVVHSRSQRTK